MESILISIDLKILKGVGIFIFNSATHNALIIPLSHNETLEKWKKIDERRKKTHRIAKDFLPLSLQELIDSPTLSV